ncbi:bile acid:sodium symporter family protein [Exilibacterium tricleocarpae]|uniref:Bile acid:sodium symporter family protein n=1 Tax=Exilibacterium tricleocarpae TaxID=2591008 RepID=A0A545T644_9GAMM|nr:bile acid:sodium symporter family protein [Exilibacterium tricleocarpae]TQV72707.1 bile acid:sodium symporter family protein [Exilibacterium tricleocarpae]
MGSFQFLVNYVFPSIVFVIMLGMGLALRPADFRLLAAKPKSMLIGLTGQMLLLPLTAIVVIHLLNPSPEIAVGLMLLAASPGGVASNAISFVIRADIALSVSLTAVSSIFVAFTLPFWGAYAIETFMEGGGQLALSIEKTMVRLMSLTILPVSIGMSIRRLAPGAAYAIAEKFRIISILLIVFLASSSAYYNREYLSNPGMIAHLAWYCFILLAAAMFLAYFLVRATRLPAAQATTILVEVGIQNVAITLLFSMTILQDPAIARLPVVYSMLMICMPWLFIYYLNRSRGKAARV